jgi:zinc protease
MRYKKLFRLSPCVSAFLIFMLFLLALPTRAQERFRRSPPYPEPYPEYSLPAIETHSLTNGLDLAVVRREDHPLICLRLIILTGESSSPNDLPGLATLTARMLPMGTATLSASDIEERIESIGGNLKVDIFPDYSTFTLCFLEEYLDEALMVLAEMILRPTFPRNEIANVQRTMFYELATQNMDPEFVARRVLFRILFENHPYKKIAFNQGVIKNLNRRNIVSFFSDYYRPNNAKLVLTGNLNLETASRKVSRYLSPWEKKDLQYSVVPSLNPREKIKICFISLPRAKDAVIYFGNIIFPIASPDYFPFVVFNQIIGGTSNSRLFMHLRESKGYAYYAFSEMQFFESSGVFLIRAKVRTEVIGRALAEMLKEIEAITKSQIPSQEIEQAKSYLIGNFPLNIDTIEKLSLKISEIQAFELGITHWEKYQENIMRITSEMVSRMGQKYSLDTPVIVIVGDHEILNNLREVEEIAVYNTDGVLQYTIHKGDME